MELQEFQQRYSVTDLLGEGGFGEVFKAYDTVRDRFVALKVSKVRPELENVRLRKEVELINCLPEHPNIAYYEACYTFHDKMLGEYDYGILQYYEEGNLLQLLNRDAARYFSYEQKTAILTQMLDGLEFLHNQGVIHRDLKPQNILIVRRQSGEYIPKITDFGISKKFDANRSTVYSNSLTGAGTLAYSSPEQLADREIRKNSDLWSFGVIAFRVLTHQLPFTTGDHAATSEAGRLELFSQINSGRLPDCIRQIDEPWQTLIRCCLITDPSQRIKNVQEAKALLAVSRGNNYRDGNHGRDVAFYISTNTNTNDKTKIERPSPEPDKSIVPPKQEASIQSSPVLKYVFIGVASAAFALIAAYGLQQWNSRKGGNGKKELAVIQSEAEKIMQEQPKQSDEPKITPEELSTQGQASTTRTQTNGSGTSAQSNSIAAFRFAPYTETASKPLSRVTIDKNLNYYVAHGNQRERKVAFNEIVPFLQERFEQEPDMYVALYADEAVPYGEVVKVMHIAYLNKFNMLFMTRLPAKGLEN